MLIELYGGNSMINQELVSVVIPFYREVKWLYEAIESVLSQTYSNIEIIVINDGSKESVSTFLKDYSEKIRYFKQENKGAAAARNAGINLSKGQYVAFLDSDDVWMPDKIEKQLSYMKKNGYKWSHTGYRFFGQGVKDIKKDVSYFKDQVFPICIISSPIATPCVMIKSSILNCKKLNFCEYMDAGEDTYLWLNLAMKYNLGLIDEDLTKVRLRGTNTATLAYSQIQSRSQIWEYLKKNGNNENLSMIVRSAFYLCSIFYKILLKINNGNQKRIEILAKVLYVTPWLFFKVEKQRLMKRSK